MIEIELNTDKNNFYIDEHIINEFNIKYEFMKYYIIYYMNIYLKFIPLLEVYQ